MSSAPPGETPKSTESPTPMSTALSSHKPSTPTPMRPCFRSPTTTTATTVTSTTPTPSTTTVSPSTTSTTLPSSTTTSSSTSTSTTIAKTTTPPLRTCFTDRSTTIPPTPTSVPPEDSTFLSTSTEEGDITESTQSTTEAPLEFNETRCEVPCPEGWAEGETACFQAVHSDVRSFNKLAAMCTKVEGHSMPNRFDFESRINYELFEELTFAVDPIAYKVLQEPEPSLEFRLDRRVVAVDIQKSFWAARNISRHKENAEVEDLVGICRKPKFCTPVKCNVSQYFLNPSAVNLILLEDVELLHVKQSTKVLCNVTGTEIEVTCQGSGFLTPYADATGCFGKEEVVEELRRKEKEAIIAGWYTNKPVRSCRECSPRGTANCTNNGNGSFSCNCLPGWVGTLCGKSPDYCDKKGRCQNGGKCHNFVTEFYCTCDGQFKGDDCSLDVHKLDFSNATVKASFVPLTYLLIALAITCLVLFFVTLYEDASHPQSTTQCVKHLALFAAALMSALFRHPNIVGLDPFVGCRVYHWLITLGWEIANVSWLLEAHLCWGVTSNNFMNVWGYGGRRLLKQHTRMLANVLPPLLLATAGKVIFWDEVNFAWSCMGTFHNDGKDLILFIFCCNGAILFFTLSYWEKASQFRDERWLQYVRLYRTTVDDPFEYGRHMELAEKNVKFTCLGPVLHFLTWLCVVGANDAFEPRVTALACVFGVAYILLLIFQVSQTIRPLLSWCKKVATLYGPYALAPYHDYATLMEQDETIAWHQPERFKKLLEAKRQRIQRAKQAEHEEIERRNEVIRRRYTEENGGFPEDCPATLLYHHPEEGPERIDPERFKYRPYEKEDKEHYIPALRRNFIMAEFSKAYLKHRQDPEIDALAACVKLNHNEQEAIIGELNCGTFHLWTMFCRRVIGKDHYLSKESVEESLRLFETRDYSKRLTTQSLEKTPLGPKMVTIMKDLDAILPCQMERYMKIFREEQAQRNAPFDKVYEDDLVVPPHAEVVSKKHVENVDNETQEISLNPRRRPLDDFFYDTTVPGFVGPLDKKDEISVCIDRDRRNRKYFQVAFLCQGCLEDMGFQKRIDREWEEDEELGAKLRAREAFRKKHPISMWRLMQLYRSRNKRNYNVRENQFVGRDSNGGDDIPA
ncbi:hypothetical protein QR680_016615 [Steinernema hermaphroditum]|uniref:EGF-like domain-containing protein n=1 Tax=Steinernema hermaphroditum TaxID=289476 RepID=A0AA39HDX2_9BILA|nr:hypothetical protein QR680_016615 [Steinernema hermaphroditum]